MRPILLLCLAVLAAAAEPGATRAGEADPAGGDAVGGPGLAPAAALAPFTLPWDDGEPGPTDVGFLTPKPAGARGRVTATPDGDLAIAGEKTRFLGVNVCFGAAIPPEDQAPRIAARLRKLGINIQFNAYWDAYTPEIVRRYMESGKAPGHAAEFETSFAMAASPEKQ